MLGNGTLQSPARVKSIDCFLTRLCFLHTLYVAMTAQRSYIQNKYGTDIALLKRNRVDGITLEFRNVSLRL